MRIENEEARRLHRGPGKCEWCLKQCQTRECAHVYAKGLGGGHTLDIPINLVALGIGGWVGIAAECNCHSDHHAGREPTRRQLLEIAAKREGVDPDDAEYVILMLKRLPKDPAPWDIAKELDQISGERLSLAMRILWAAKAESEPKRRKRA